MHPISFSMLAMLTMHPFLLTMLTMLTTIWAWNAPNLICNAYDAPILINNAYNAYNHFEHEMHPLICNTCNFLRCTQSHLQCLQKFWVLHAHHLIFNACNAYDAPNFICNAYNVSNFICNAYDACNNLSMKCTHSHLQCLQCLRCTQSLSLHAYITHSLTYNAYNNCRLEDLALYYASLCSVPNPEGALSDDLKGMLGSLLLNSLSLWATSIVFWHNSCDDLGHDVRGNDLEEVHFCFVYYITP